MVIGANMGQRGLRATAAVGESAQVEGGKQMDAAVTSLVMVSPNSKFVHNLIQGPTDKGQR